ncbi:MAG TPA: LytTR family DNA-binding domain-containing protein [Gammaproteobacteria bacterium]|nr:LytTR family transcriptional regulator [Gammaproteobacteria bacterium]HKV97682.1 LytTR family DNA-binding domain-containing protein [Gammaproteobacteria bacterium]
MTEESDRLPELVISRRVRGWQIAFFVVLVVAFATVNVFTALANKASDGIVLSPWEPVVWEFSSAILIWALIPVIAWFNSRVLISVRSWKWALPSHLLATLPFSIIHVSGMVALRELAYTAAGRHYEFGAPLGNWIYEYRKDFVTYWMILAALYAFRVYRLWLESRLAPAPVPTATGGVERLVVRKLNREFILNTAEIDRIESDGNYVTIHAQGASYPLRESLASLEKRLDPKRFARVHRGHIVNLDRIREIQPWDSGDYRILLKDGSFVNFSRRYRSRLPQLFDS